ncbi:tetratricopeptide repeat protein [bacterium]|nr:tetratricopeptide repeat protein [bacterium]MBP9808013.1 tetratricopeptide repeat protein [bacterium]
MSKIAILCLSAVVSLTIAAEARALETTEVTTNEKQAKVATPKVLATVKAKAKAAEESDIQPTRDSDDVFTETSGRSLLLTAKQYMRHHNYNRAIALLSRAVKLDPDDPDIRCLYAEALQEKLSHQVEKDPAVFNLCVRNWLTVVRNEVGEEKGATYKGIGIGMGYFQDEERTTFAKHSLKALTGYLPKPWETNDRYLRRVLKPATTSVTATIRMPDETSPKANANSEP